MNTNRRWQDSDMGAAGMIRASIERERSVPKAETSIKPLLVAGGVFVAVTLLGILWVVGR